MNLYNPFPDQGEWHALAKSAYEDVLTLGMPLKRQGWHEKQARLKEDTRNFESMRGFYRVIRERHEGLERVQELVHNEDAFIWQKLGFPER
jgi:hypothetical protein